MRELKFYALKFANFIAGMETWINSIAYNNEIFPHDYQVFWVYRKDGYKGVFNAPYIVSLRYPV